MSSQNAPGAPSTLPQSPALAEASADGPAASITEAFSRDPEQLSKQDRQAIIAAMREFRARLEKAELEGKVAPRVRASELSKSAPRDASEMGL